MNSVQIRRLRNSALAATLLLTCVLSNSGGSPDTFSQTRTTPALSNRLIIKFKDGATTTSGTFDFRAAASQLDGLGTRAKQPGTGVVGLRHLKSITSQTHVALTAQPMPRAELFALAKRLEQDPAVAYAEIDEIAYPQMVPNDPLYAANQWHYMAPATFAGGANLPLAWDSATGAGVVVAVIDTGYRPHADLAANILPGYDFISSFGAGPSATTVDSNDGDARDADASDPGDWHSAGACGSPTSLASNSSWHGTHVAGTIAAVTNNNLGGAGVAFNAKVLPVRALGVCGGFVSDIAAGMQWAVGLNVPGVPDNPAANKAKVLNLSLGAAAACPKTFQDAVNAVRAAGSVVVAATGNDASTSIGAPANCAGVIAVTAHTKLGDNASYANVGMCTTLSAPGGGTGTVIAGDGSQVYSTLNAGVTGPGVDTYGAYSGTSMATPHVAGVAALLASLQPNITPDALQSALSNSTRAHPAGTFCVGRSDCGSGLLDARAAIDRLNSLAPSSAASTTAALRLTGSTVALTGQAAAVAGGSGTFSYQWTQLAGSPVIVIGSTSSSASFVAPSPGGNYPFNFSVTDGNGLTSSSQVCLTTDTPPVLDAISNKGVVTGGHLTFTVTATDAESDTVVFGASGLPSGATLNAATGVLNWSNAGPAGNYSVTITPSDGKFNGTAQTVCISVNANGAASSCSVASGGGGGGGALTLLDLVGLLLSLCVGLLLSLRRTSKK